MVELSDAGVLTGQDEKPGTKTLDVGKNRMPGVFFVPPYTGN